MYDQHYLASGWQASLGIHLEITNNSIKNECIFYSNSFTLNLPTSCFLE